MAKYDPKQVKKHLAIADELNQLKDNIAASTSFMKNWLESQDSKKIPQAERNFLEGMITRYMQLSERKE
jgi:hypothetical protein